MAIDNFSDVLDSRDIIARIDQLQSLRVPGPVEGLDAEDETMGQDDLFAELASLEALAAEGEDASEDWEHGAQLVRDSYFKNHAMELADDCGMIPKDAVWPMTCIDWDQAARELRMDYTPVDFDGVTYWVR